MRTRERRNEMGATVGSGEGRGAGTHGARARRGKGGLVDGVGEKLDDAAKEATKMAAEAPPESQPARKKIAESAADGHKKLRELARREGA